MKFLKNSSPASGKLAFFVKTVYSKSALTGTNKVAHAGVLLSAEDSRVKKNGEGERREWGKRLQFEAQIGES